LKKFEVLTIDMANIATDLRLEEMKKGKLSSKNRKILKAVEAMFDILTPVKFPKEMERAGDIVNTLHLLLGYTKIIEGCKRCKAELKKGNG